MLINAIIMEDIYILSDAQIQKKIGEKIKATHTLFRLKYGETSCFTLKSALTKGFWRIMKHET